MMLEAKPRRRLASALKAMGARADPLLSLEESPWVESQRSHCSHHSRRPQVTLALIAFPLAMVLDTLAQRSLLLALGQRVRFGTLLLGAAGGGGRLH